MILTKLPNVFDPIGETDRENILDQYKSKEGKYIIVPMPNTIDKYEGFRGPRYVIRSYFDTTQLLVTTFRIPGGEAVTHSCRSRYS